MPTAASRRCALLALLFLSLGACERPEQVSEQAPSAVPSGRVARSDTGVISTAAPLATAAGLQMLQRGGNAADAAVAAAFALAVVEPSMSGLGGRMQVLLRTPRGALRAIDATTQAPMAYDSELVPAASYGYGTVGIPGMVAGAIKLLDEEGSLPLATIMGPAIDYARSGIVLDADEAARIASQSERLAESEGGRRYFLKSDGSTYEGGDLFVQTDLARTLERISRGGVEAFYRGAIAEQMVDDMEANGGFVTLADLAQYRAVDSRVLRGTYRGFELVGSDVPAGGGTVIEVLQMLEQFDLTSASEEEWLGLVGQALVLGFEDYYGSGFLEEERADILTSKEWARERARAIRVPAAATPAAGLGLVGDGLGEMGAMVGSNRGHTSHLSVIDREGRVVALTQSLGPAMGSRVVAPGLGFVYAATLGGYLGPIARGQRASSAISPFFIQRDGEPLYALGAAGGLRIIAGVVEVTSRLIDRNQPLEDAVAGARFFPGMSRSGAGPWEIETSDVASWDAPPTLALIQALGFEATANPSATSYSRVHAVGVEPNGGLIGVADPRWGGSAGGVPGDTTTTGNGESGGDR